MSKSHLAPQDEVSVPRLELIAAVGEKGTKTGSAAFNILDRFLDRSSKYTK